MKAGIVAAVVVAVLAGACSGPTVVRYQDQALSQCAAGRSYVPPPAGREATVALVPVEPARTVPEFAEDDKPAEDAEPVAKPVKKKKSKQPAKKKKTKQRSPKADE